MTEGEPKGVDDVNIANEANEQNTEDMCILDDPSMLALSYWQYNFSFYHKHSDITTVILLNIFKNSCHFSRLKSHGKC